MARLSKKDIAKRKKKLLSNAKYCKDFTTLAKNTRISRAAIYRYFEDDDQFELDLKQTLGSSLSKEENKQAEKRRGNNIELRHKKKVNKSRSRETESKFDSRGGVEEVEGYVRKQPVKNDGVITPAKTDTSKISMPSGKLTRHEIQETVIKVKPTNQHFKHTIEEKIVKGLQICSLIEKGGTVGQACEIVGIVPSTFYRWRTMRYDEGIQDIADAYKDAKEVFNFAMSDEIEMLSRIGLHRLLKDRKTTSTTKIGRVNKEGVVKANTVIQRENVIEPSFSAVKFALSKLDVKKFGDVGDKSFAAKEKSTAKDENPYELRAMSLEDIQKEKQKLLDKLAANKDQSEPYKESKDEEE